MCLFPFHYSSIPAVFYFNNNRINHVRSVNITTPRTHGSPDVYLSKISIDKEATNDNHQYTAFDICLNVAKKTSWVHTFLHVIIRTDSDHGRLWTRGLEKKKGSNYKIFRRANRKKTITFKLDFAVILMIWFCEF